MAVLALLLSLVATTGWQTTSADTLRFAPLPMEDRKILLSQYAPLLAYLGETTGDAYRFRFYDDYGRILQALHDDEVDVAYLGPLPYVRLTAKDEDFVPLVQFLNEGGKTTYTCALLAFGGDRIDLEDLEGRRVALTQPYSTCGYLVTEALLRREGASLAANDFDYTGSHSEAILSVVRGTHAIAGARTSIARKFAHLDVTVLAESDPLPGFLLVANPRTTTDAQRAAIREALVGLDPAGSEADRERLSHWGAPIRFGAVPAEDSAYQGVRELDRQLPSGIPGIDR